MLGHRAESFALKEFYGSQIEIQAVMGGMVKDMANFSDGHNGISSARAVMPHWREVSERTGQPVDENLWLELEKLPHFSTWPANIAAKAAALQGKDLGERFLRRIRRAALTERRNVSNEAVLTQLAGEVPGIDVARFKADLQSKEAHQAFREDLALAQSLGVTGFPSLVFFAENTASSEQPQTHRLYGYRPLRYIENTLKLLAPQVERNLPRPVEDLLSDYGPLTTRELSEICELSMAEMETQLQALSSSDRIFAESLRGGTLWRLR